MSDDVRIDVADEPRSARTSRWKPWFAAALVVIAIGNVVRVPYYSIGPGPATDVLELVDVDGAPTFEAEGDLLLTTAALSNQTLTVFEYLWTYADPALEAVPEDALVPPGSSDAEQDAENFRQMEESKVAAMRAAYQALGVKVPRIPGARVLTVLEGSAADGKLKSGDRVVRLDDTPIRTPIDLIEGIGAHKPGDEIVVEVMRRGDDKSYRVKLKADRKDPKAARLGVTLANAFDFPADIDIDTQRIGGPSGGLVFALALLELLGEEDLTRGRTIAVTGLIGFKDGVALVGPIGGIAEKIRGVVDSGAEMFIVPKDNEAAARAAAPDGLVIVGVRTFEEAVAALRAEDPSALSSGD